MKAKTIEQFGVEDIEMAKNTSKDLFYLAKKAEAEGKKLPRIFQCCGTEDFGIDNARKTKDWFINETSFEYTYDEGPEYTIGNFGMNGFKHI